MFSKNMKVLALETATDFTGAAVVDEGAFTPHQGRDTGFAGFIIGNNREKGEKIIASIDKLLKDNNLGLEDIDLLAAGIGPGFYTGLRIGLSIMKGFAISTGKPLIGIPTLDTIAYNFLGHRERIFVILNAYGGEAYGALYDVKNRITRESNYFVGPVEYILKKARLVRNKISNVVKDPVIFVGSGLKIYQKQIEEILGHGAVFSPEESWIPHPGSLARLALKRFKRGALPHPDKILPLYLKKSEAERKWEKYRSLP